MNLIRRKKGIDEVYFDKKKNELIHFIRTPLASIKAGAQIIKDVMPELIEAYKSSAESEALGKGISNLKLNKLDCVLNNVLHEAERISEYINNLDKNNLN